VVGVSDAAATDADEQIGNPICDICGFEIDELDKDCPGLDDGRCRP